MAQPSNTLIPEPIAWLVVRGRKMGTGLTDIRANHIANALLF
jgi:hypothetical protein